MDHDSPATNEEDSSSSRVAQYACYENSLSVGAATRGIWILYVRHNASGLVTGFGHGSVFRCTARARVLHNVLEPVDPLHYRELIKFVVKTFCEFLSSERTNLVV